RRDALRTRDGGALPGALAGLAPYLADRGGPLALGVRPDQIECVGVERAVLLAELVETGGALDRVAVVGQLGQGPERGLAQGLQELRHLRVVPAGLTSPEVPVEERVHPGG